MQTAEEKYLDGFRQWWLSQGRSAQSAKTYCAGIKRANDSFFKITTSHDLFESLDQGIATDSAVSWLMALISIITCRIAETMEVAEHKSYIDIRTYLRKFLDYIRELTDARADSEVGQGAIDPSLLPDGKQYYSRQDLQQAFMSRLGRYNYLNKDADIVLPILLLRNLFDDADNAKRPLLLDMGIVSLQGRAIAFNQWYNRWARSLVSQVVFHTVKGDYHLGEIDGVLIDAKTQRVWVRVNGRDVVMLSEGTEGFNEMRATALCDIRILRAESVDKLLGRLSPSLIGLRMLTADIRKIPKRYRVLANWNILAPILSIIRHDLTYIACAARLTAISRDDKQSKKGT